MSPDLHVNKISGYLSPGSQTVKRAINPVQLAARPSHAAASGRGEHGRRTRRVVANSWQNGRKLPILGNWPFLANFGKMLLVFGCIGADVCK